MTLNQTVLFPHAIVPLYIFENRYRKMIEDVLAGDRIFIVAHQRATSESTRSTQEPAYELATAGVIRMCSHNDDGTSNVMLQGISRVKLNHIVSESPYRLFDATPVESKMAEENKDAFRNQHQQFLSLVRTKESLGENYAPEIRAVFENMKNEGMLADLASHIFCQEGLERQALLETIDSSQRLDRLMKTMRKDIAALKLNNKLQGPLPDDDIVSN